LKKDKGGDLIITKIIGSISSEKVMELILNALIEKGVDISLPDKWGGTFLHHAAGKGMEKIVKFLLARPSNNINSQNSSGETPLFQAIISGKAEIVKLLLDKGADISITTSYGTVLHFANSDPELLSILLNHPKCPDINKKNRDGKTALEDVLSDSRFNKEAAQLLIAKGAQVNLKDFQGWTPLHHAVWDEVFHKKRLEAIKFILEQGAKVDIKNDQGKTPLDFAIEKGRDDLVELMQNYASKK